MKLISKFKDYYDYNIGLYGVDEKVIYNRLPFNDEYTHKLKDAAIANRLPILEYGLNNDGYIYYLLFCGRIFYIKTKSLTNMTYEMMSPEDIQKIHRSSGHSRGYYHKIDSTKIDSAVMEIHKKTNQPVLIMKYVHRDRIHLDKNLPVLQDLKGFPARVDAKRCYLDITQCIIDINNTEIIPSITDTDKVTSHGFDKKISFRHRR